MTFGQTIKALRKEGNMTQENLAEKIGCSVEYLSRVENGKCAPGTKYLTAISNVLNIPADNLLGAESNFIIHEQVSELEQQLLKLNADDRTLIINTMINLIERLTPSE